MPLTDRLELCIMVCASAIGRGLVSSCAVGDARRTHGRAAQHRERLLLFVNHASTDTIIRRQGKAWGLTERQGDGERCLRRRKKTRPAIPVASTIRGGGSGTDASETLSTIQKPP